MGSLSSANFPPLRADFKIEGRVEFTIFPLHKSPLKSLILTSNCCPLSAVLSHIQFMWCVYKCVHLHELTAAVLIKSPKTLTAWALF